MRSSWTAATQFRHGGLGLLGWHGRKKAFGGSADGSIRASIRSIAGFAASNGSAELAGVTASVNLTFGLDHLM